MTQTPHQLCIHLRDSIYAHEATMGELLSEKAALEETLHQVEKALETLSDLIPHAEAVSDWDYDSTPCAHCLSTKRKFRLLLDKFVFCEYCILDQLKCS